jgi:hypothetical protein
MEWESQSNKIKIKNLINVHHQQNYWRYYFQEFMRFLKFWGCSFIV